ncbi:MAG: CHAT domain-containing protein, partial [Armatimonadetes bacterium]|nr:CHAT domain-containing protein [Armatimonadota bacterium]
RDVLCSLWPVSDESTKKLMETFYADWLKGKSTEEALQTAQLALLKDKATAAPFYWAAFVAVRGPR